MPQISPFERLVYDFKNHHPRPEALGRRPFLVQIGSTILFAALPASIVLNLFCLALPMSGWLIAGTVVLIIGGTLAQYSTAPSIGPTIRGSSGRCGEPDC